MGKIIADPSLIRALIMGLIIGCPCEGNITSCLAFDIRKLPIDEKIAWLKSISDDEYRKIYLQYHYNLQV